MHHHSLEAKRASKTNFVCVQVDISTLFCLVLYIVLHTRKTSIVTRVNMSRSSFAKTSATFHRNHRASSSSSSSGKLSARTRLHPNHRRGNRKQRANNFAANKNATALTTRAGPGNSKNQKFALLFDCDGVLVETEELHRLAYNKSFEHLITNRNRNANGMGPVVLRRLGEYRRRRETENAMAFQGEQMADGHEER